MVDAGFLPQFVPMLFCCLALEMLRKFLRINCREVFFAHEDPKVVRAPGVCLEIFKEEQASLVFYGQNLVGVPPPFR